MRVMDECDLILRYSPANKIIFDFLIDDYAFSIYIISIAVFPFLLISFLLSFWRTNIRENELCPLRVAAVFIPVSHYIGN